MVSECHATLASNGIQGAVVLHPQTSFGVIDSASGGLAFDFFVDPFVVHGYKFGQFHGLILPLRGCGVAYLLRAIAAMNQGRCGSSVCAL